MSTLLPSGLNAGSALASGARAGSRGSGVAGVAPPPDGGGSIPTDGLDMWWDASDEATITATGSNVTLLTDKSGNGNDLANVGAEPQTGTRSVNGLNVLDCYAGGVERVLFRASPTTEIYNNRAFTLFALVDWDHSDTSRTVFSLCPVSDQDHQGIIIQATGGGTETVDVAKGDGAPYGSAADTRTDRFTTSFSTASAFRLLTVRGDVNGTVARVNGQTLAGPSQAGGSMPQANFLASPAGNLGVGVGRRQHSSGLAAWRARDFGEMAVYAAALTNEDVMAIEAILAAKWGITLSETLDDLSPSLYVPASSLDAAAPLPDYATLVASIPNVGVHVPADAKLDPVLYDDFQRPDAAGDLGAQWGAELSGGVASVSTGLMRKSGGGTSIRLASGTTPGSDQDLSVDVVAHASDLYLIGRNTGGAALGNYYMGGYEAGQWVIYRYNPSGSIIASATGAVNLAGKNLRMTLIGSTITLLVDDSPVLSVVDATISGQGFGFRAYQSTTDFDNFRAFTP